MKILQGLKEYLNKYNLRIRTTRVASFYRQEIDFNDYYNSNELDRLITDIYPFYSNGYADLVIATEITPIGDEKVLFDEIRRIQTIGVDGIIGIDLMEEMKEILMDIEIEKPIIVYPNFEFEQRGVTNDYNKCDKEYIFSCKFRRTHSKEWTLLEYNDNNHEILVKSQASINESIGLEIAFIQWCVNKAGNIIRTAVDKLKRSMEGQGIDIPFISSLEEETNDLLGFGNYGHGNPLAIFDKDTKVTIN